jgi:NitT/TauT family transport system substrate-binding protein
VIVMPVIRTRLLYAIPLLACLFADASVSHAQKLRVAYTAFAGTFTILWLGKDAGLYQKQGVDMELLFIGSSTTAVQALLAGDVDIVYSAAGAVVDANLAGADLTMIGCQYDTGQTSFFTTPAVATVAALKGKAVGVSRFGAFSDFVARYVLKKNRLQPIKDVALLQLGGTREIIGGMQKNWCKAEPFHYRSVCKRASSVSGNCSLRLRLSCLLTTGASSLKTRRCTPDARN